MTQILYRPHVVRSKLPIVGGGTDWTKTNPNPMQLAADSETFGEALSSYGNLLLVGSPNNGSSGDYGFVTLYSTADGGDSWTLLATIRPPAEDSSGVSGFGAAVSIWGDYILIGSPNDTINGIANVGSVYAYTLNQTTKAYTFRQRIFSPTTVADCHFGRELDHYAGNAVIACDNGAQASSSKRAYAYKTSNNGLSWQMKSVLLPASDALVNAFNFGYELYIFGDWITVAAYSENNATGVVYIYRTFDSGETWTRTQEINAPVQAANSYFGFALAMNEFLLAIGAPGANSGKGAVYVYGPQTTGTNTQWVLKSTIVAPVSVVTDFASTVELQDGVLLVGAPGAQLPGVTNPGGIFIYLDDETNVGTFPKPPITVPPPTGTSTTNFGSQIVTTPGSIVSGGGGGSVTSYKAPVTTPTYASYFPPVVQSPPVNTGSFGGATSVPSTAIVPTKTYATGGGSVVTTTQSGGIGYVGSGYTYTIPPIPQKPVSRVTVTRTPADTVIVGGSSPQTNEVIIYKAPSPEVTPAPIIVKPPVEYVKGVPVFNFGIELVLDGNTLTVMDGNGNVFTFTTPDDGTTWEYQGAINIPGVSGAAELVRFSNTMVVTNPNATRFGTENAGGLQINVTFDNGKTWHLSTITYPSDDTMFFGRKVAEDNNILIVSSERRRSDGTYEGVLYVYEINRDTLVWRNISVITDPETAEHLPTFGSNFEFDNSTVVVTVPERIVSPGYSAVYMYQTPDSGYTWILMRTLAVPEGTTYAALTDAGLLLGPTATTAQLTVISANYTEENTINLGDDYSPTSDKYDTPIKVSMFGAASGYSMLEYFTVHAPTTVPNGAADQFSIMDKNNNLIESIPSSLRYETNGRGFAMIPVTPTTRNITIATTGIASAWRVRPFAPIKWACPLLPSLAGLPRAFEVNNFLQDSMGPTAARRISTQMPSSSSVTQTVFNEQTFYAYKNYPSDYSFSLTQRSSVTFSVKQTQLYPYSGKLSILNASGALLWQTYWGGNGTYSITATLDPGSYKFRLDTQNYNPKDPYYNKTVYVTYKKTYPQLFGTAVKDRWYAFAMLHTISGNLTFAGVADKTANIDLYADGSSTPITVPGGFSPTLQTRTLTVAPNTTYFVVATIDATIGTYSYLNLNAKDSGVAILITSSDWRTKE